MSDVLLTVKVAGVKHFARQPGAVTLCGLDVWGRNATSGDADCPKCMVEAERRWTVVCTATASCGWKGFRVAPSAARARAKPCPHCGSHVRVKAYDRG